MSGNEVQSATGGKMEPVANNVYGQTRELPDSRIEDDLEPGEFSVENIERIYR